MELTLQKSILENDVRAVLETISGMKTQETNDGFSWNKEQLAEIEETAKLLTERVNQLECEDAEEVESFTSLEFN